MSSDWVVQVPDLTLWYGPDTYMGANLEELFTSLAALPDEEVRQLHPGAPPPPYPPSCMSHTISASASALHHTDYLHAVLQSTRKPASMRCYRGCTTFGKAPASCTTCSVGK